MWKSIVPMLGAFAITFVDSLEAFLVIGATIAFLRKTRQPELVSAVVLGTLLSVAASAFGAWLFSRLDNQALWNGRLALVAAAGVAGLGVYMWRGRTLLTDTPRPSPPRAGPGLQLAFFLLTALVMSREGMHTVLLIGTFVIQIRIPTLTAGVVSGLALAAGVAWLWARYGHRLRLPVFVPVTVVVLALAMAQLINDARDNLAGAVAPPVRQLEFERGP